MLNTEQSLLLHLAEECNEVAQRVSKILRFGIDEVQDGHTDDNRRRLEMEIADWLAVHEMLLDMGIVSVPTWDEIDAKKEKVRKYRKLSEDRGLVA